jgi:essential nuclear protein 1
VDEADQAILDQFLPNAPAQRRNLADLVMEKIRQYEARQVAKASGTAKESKFIKEGVS